jgi:hypothetical protein
MDSEKAYQLMFHTSLQILILKHGARKCMFLNSPQAVGEARPV